MLSVSLKRGKMKFFWLWSFPLHAFSVLPGVIFDRNIFWLLCFVLKSLNALNWKQFFSGGLWALFYHFLVFLKTPQVSAWANSCLERTKSIESDLSNSYFLLHGRVFKNLIFLWHWCLQVTLETAQPEEWVYTYC